jgi:hypothetical protein
MSTLQELIARVEAASGPDEELDCILHSAVALGRRVTEDGNDIWEHDDRLGSRLLGRLDPGKVRRNFNIHVRPGPSYTSSLDAAVRLVEEKLPFGIWSIHRGDPRMQTKGATVLILRNADPDGEDEVTFRDSAATPALALVAALLRALAGDAP